MKPVFTLNLPADLEKLTSLRKFIRDKAAALEARGQTVRDLVLAADEIVTNIIVHGYKQRQGVIEAEIGRDGDGLYIRLRDQAPPFDPTTVPQPDLTVPLERRSPGGMGIYLARNVTDEISYRRTPDGANELTIIKKSVFQDQYTEDQSGNNG